MTRVFVSIGSNFDREHNVRSALHNLRARFGPLTVSPVYETAAVGFDGDAFYNLVVGFDTELEPEELARSFHGIEAEHGRRRGPSRFASRTLDIDLLTWGDRILDGGSLTLPRGEILKYGFVLGPLADIAGDVRHPSDGRSYRELWTALRGGFDPLTPVDMPLD